MSGNVLELTSVTQDAEGPFQLGCAQPPEADLRGVHGQ